MSTHAYLPLYVDDYEAATAHLTPAEDGVYSRLLRLCWRTPGCSLPNDDAWIARKIRLSASDYAKIAKPVIDEFFKVQRGRLVQKRLKAEYDDISRKKSARVNAGKMGGTAKALKNKASALSNASVLPAHTRAFPEPTPEPKKEKDANASPVAGGDAKAAFDEWNALAKRLSLPTAKDLTPARRKAINARLATAGLDGWREALAAVEASPHCRGENDRGWRADIDFVATAAKFQKLREGSYGAVPTASPAEPATFNGPPSLRASIVQAKDEDFARRWLDHYCTWDPVNRILNARTPAVAATMRQALNGWCERMKVTIASPDNDSTATPAQGAAA